MNLHMLFQEYNIPLFYELTIEYTLTHMSYEYD